MNIFKITIFINFILILGVVETNAQWINISNGIGNLQVYSLLDNGSNIYAGTATNGLYWSTNNGSSWTFAGLNARIIFSLTMFSNYLYAGSDIGIWRSSNNGAYWIGPSINGNAIYSLASNSSRVFAGLHNSTLFYSTGGSNWMISSLGATNVKAIAVNGDILFAGCANNQGVYKSTNNGNNWVSTSLNYKSVYSLAMNGNDIYAGTGSGVYHSTNSGDIWLQTTLNNELVYALAVSGNNVFAGTELHGVFASNNNGSNWTQINDGLNNITVNSLRIINGFIFAGAANGVYRRELGEITAIKITSSELPDKFELSQNYPNPFNPLTRINFSIPITGYVKLEVYDASGKAVDELINADLNAGTHEIAFDATALSSGVYYYKLTAGDITITKKMILIK